MNEPSTPGPVAAWFRFAPGWRRTIGDAILFCALIWGGHLLLAGIENTRDIMLHDEAVCLSQGITAASRGLPKAQDAPLYAAWYFMLSQAMTDTVDLYYLNLRLLTILPALLAYLLLRAWRIPAILAFPYAFVFLVWTASFLDHPMVSFFACGILFGGAILVRWVRTLPSRTASVMLLSFIVSYARPEFFFAGLIASIVALITALRTGKRTRFIQSILPFTISSVVTIVLLITLGFPLRGSRKLIAFGQHYALNWVQEHRDPRNPWTQWESIVASDFGTVATPADAFVSNPSAMIQHITWNVHRLPGMLAVMSSAWYPLRGTWQWPVVSAGGIALAILFSGMSGPRRPSYRERLMVSLRNHRFDAAFVALLIVPVFASIVMIFPRIHYLYIACSLVCTALFVTCACPAGVVHRTVHGILLGLLIASFPITLGSFTDMPLATSSQRNLRIIQHLRSLHITDRVSILEAEGGYDIHAGANYRRIPEFRKKAGFGAFLRAESINMVVLTESLRNDNRFVDDPEWATFLSHPSDFGFDSFRIPGADDALLFVKRGLH